MNQKNKSRSVNIIVCAIGVLCCVLSGIVSAPEGILDNGSANLISTMPVQSLVFLYVIPVLLMVAACIMVAVGKYDIPSAAAVLCGAGLFALMDIRLISENQMFSGVLINMFGVILAVAGVALQIFATDNGDAKISRRAAKKRNAKDVPYERRQRPSYNDIYADNAAEFAALNKAAEEKLPESTAADDDDILAQIRMNMQNSENALAEDNKSDGNDSESHDTADEELRKLLAEAETEPAQKSAASNNAQSSSDDSDVSAALIALLESDEDAAPSEDAARANMAAALETPDPVMADFYGGIEDIFLND